jgi:hypothetical protein
VGVFTKAIPAQPEKTLGKYVAYFFEAITNDQMLQY